jgi:hypothetical protein
MIINTGDYVYTKDGREGTIVNIGIATEKNDKAAENDTSLNAKTYDTDLNYIGAITYSGDKGTYWCYFDQIYRVEGSAVNDLEWMHG